MNLQHAIQQALHIIRLKGKMDSSRCSRMAGELQDATGEAAKVGGEFARKYDLLVKMALLGGKEKGWPKEDRERALSLLEDLGIEMTRLP